MTSVDRNSVLGRTIRLLILLAAAWAVMVLTHESGHIVGGWLGGADLVEADLRPWRLPYSLHEPDPRPLLTLWCGPLLGIAVPAAAAAVIRRPAAWFVADFCLLANGGYLALAWLSGEPQLDTPRLLAAGTHPAWVVLYCSLTIPVGYARFRSDCVRVLLGRRQDATPE
jgi:hypothetical protein